MADFTKHDLIVALKEAVEIDGYEIISNYVQAVALKKKTPMYKNEIIFGYRKLPGVYDLGQLISGFKSFPEIEDLLGKYYKKYNIESSLYSIYFHSRRVEKLKLNNDYYIGSKEDVNKILPYLKEWVYEDLLPFFDQYQTIEQVYEHLESLELAKMASFVYDPLPLRRMVLKGLLKTPDFVSYSETILTFYKENAENKTYGELYQFMPELYEELLLLQ